jgi:cystathionine gamma-synthase
MTTQPSTRFEVAKQVSDSLEIGPSTQSVHAGRKRTQPYHALIEPIVQTATYTFENSAEVCDFQESHLHKEHIDRIEYGRYGNPTVSAAEARIAALEGAESAMLVSSGMAAINTILLHLLSSGDHVVLTDDCYRRTRNFCLDVLPKFGVTTTIVSMGDYKALEAAVRPETRLLLSETPTNPYLRILDLERFAEIGHKWNLITLVDTTFATPLNLRALDWGIDLVIHSATKYLSGHNDLLAGVVAGRAELLDPLRDFTGILGPVSDAQTAYLLARGLKTLGLRVERQNRSGQRVAEFLAEHPQVEQVWYPGLPQHPDHDVAIRQMKGYGGVVSFTVCGDLNDASRFIDALQIPFISPSLGGLESLVIQPAIMSYYDYTTEQRKSLGIKDNLVRLALGIEDTTDLIADLDQALWQSGQKSAGSSRHANPEDTFFDW